jgi:hypothetical protein
MAQKAVLVNNVGKKRKAEAISLNSKEKVAIAKAAFLLAGQERRNYLQQKAAKDFPSHLTEEEVVQQLQKWVACRHSRLTAQQKIDIALEALDLTGQERYNFLLLKAPDSFHPWFKPNQYSNKLRKWIISKNRSASDIRVEDELVLDVNHLIHVHDLNNLSLNKDKSVHDIINLNILKEMYAKRCREFGYLEQVTKYKLSSSWAKTFAYRYELPQYITSIVGTELQKGYRLNHIFISFFSFNYSGFFQ